MEQYSTSAQQSENMGAINMVLPCLTIIKEVLPC